MFDLFNKIPGGMTHRMSETSGMWDAGALQGVPGGLASGLVSGTRVATRLGWRPVENITVGDQVLTFDDGMQEVTRISRGYLWMAHSPVPQTLWPLRVPAGALGNQHEMLLLPEQSVVVESDTAEKLFGDPFTLIPAAALEGYEGITRVAPTGPIEVITLHFDKDQVVFGNIGALFHCPADAVSITEAADPLYTVLDQEMAAMLVECMTDEKAEAAHCAASVMRDAAAACQAAA